MSWFTDIAGKAENLLNKIDQNAATVLKQTNGQITDGSETSFFMDEHNEHSQLISNATPIEISLKANQKSILIAKTPERNKELLPVNGAKTGSNSNSRRSSISSKSSKAGGTVIEKTINNSSVNERSDSQSQETRHQNGNLENELAAAKIVLTEIKSERDELKLEVESLVEQLKNENSQSIIKELQENCNKLAQERDSFIEKYENLEKSNQNYIKSISELETKLSKLMQTENETTTKLEWAKKEAEQAIGELQQYRSKAQKTLQMKDQLIDELKTNKGHREIDTNSLSSAKLIEFENLKTENSNLSDERNMLAKQLEDIRVYVDKLETMQKEQQIEFEKRLNLLNLNFKQDERKWIQYEDEYRAQVKELQTVRDEMNRLQMEFSTKSKEKDNEINQLRTKLSQRSYMEFSNDLEERVQSLTQSLVQKQNSLETVTADRNALRFQLEKIENQHRNTMIQLRQQRPQIINVNDTDDAKAQVPMFMQENPFDTGVARRVKRAYSSLDSLGVRFGVFLRRYPLIRILAIFYVALLHFWVILVLFSSRPT